MPPDRAGTRQMRSFEALRLFRKIYRCVHVYRFLDEEFKPRYLKRRHLHFTRQTRALALTRGEFIALAAKRTCSACQFSDRGSGLSMCLSRSTLV